MAKDVLPMDGRPATITRSDFCRPEVKRIEIHIPGAQSRDITTAVAQLLDAIDRFGEQRTHIPRATGLGSLLADLHDQPLSLVDEFPGPAPLRVKTGLGYILCGLYQSDAGLNAR
jgi:hypothetical protein